MSLDFKGRHTRGRLVPAISPLKSSQERDWLQGLVSRTVHMKSFEEQVAGTCPKNSHWFEFVGLVAGTKATRFSKMASSHDGTCSENLLQGLVAGTTPFMC